MPNYHLEYYTVLGLNQNATYQDVNNKHALLTTRIKENIPSFFTADQINLAKDQLVKLLKPVSENRLVFLVDFDLTITIKTSNDALYLNNCDDQTILSNIRNPNEFRNFVLGAIAMGHRVAITTFNEKCVTHQNKRIYLARRFLMALFEPEIIGQILIVAKNDNSLRSKKNHVHEVCNKWQAQLSQIVMIDDDTEVLQNTANSLSNRITTFSVSIYNKGRDLEHLNLILLLTRSLSHLPFLREIPLLIDLSLQYLKVCSIKEGNQRTVLELFKKYILKDFDKIPPCIQLIGFIFLINNRLPYSDIIDELFKQDSFKMSVCCDATILRVLDDLIASTILPDISQDNWNKAAVTSAIMDAINQYSAKFKPSNIIRLPASKLLLITTNSDSDTLAVKFFESLPHEVLINLLQAFLARCTWKIANVLLKIHNVFLQNNLNLKQYPNHLQNSYTRLRHKIIPLSTEQQNVGRQLLLILRKQIAQQQIPPQNNLILSHYLALEITYGDIEYFSSTLESFFNLSDSKSLKQKLLLDMLNLAIIPVSCENNPLLLIPWLEVLLNNYADISNKECIDQQILDAVIQLGNVEIFNLIIKYFILPNIDIFLLNFCINTQRHDIAKRLFTLFDIKNVEESYINALVNIPQLSLVFIEEIRSIAVSKGMQLTNIDLRVLLFNAIEQGNINRVQEILNRNVILIDEEIVQFAIKQQYASILGIIIEKATCKIDANKLLHYIATMNMHSSITASQMLMKSTRCVLLRTFIISGKITLLDSTDSMGQALLHHLIERYDVDAIELLLQLGANPLVMNSNNRTALMFAKELYNHVDFATVDDDFESDYEDVINASHNPQVSQKVNLIPQLETKTQGVHDKIIEMLTTAELGHKSVASTNNNEISNFYSLVLNNQLTLTIQFITQNNNIKTILSDKENQLGLDLLNIVLFKTKNSLMLEIILSAGIDMQLCEPAMHRILSQVISQVLNATSTNSSMDLDLFNILCSHLFKNTTTKKLFIDLAILRMFLQVAARDSNTLNSGYHLIDRFVITYGCELFYHPLLSENTTGDQSTFLMKVRHAHPKNKPSELQTNFSSVISSQPSPSATTTTTTSNSARSRSDSKNILMFSPLYNSETDHRIIPGPNNNNTLLTPGYVNIPNQP